MLLLDRVQSTNSGADENPNFMTIDFVQVQSGIEQGLVGGVDAELGKRVRAAALGEGKAGSGSKFLTSAAIWQSYAPASKAVMRSTPHLPSRRFCQNDWISSPKGVTTPRPVT